MKTELRIMRNTATIGAGHAVAQLSSFAFVIYFARAFGATTFGQYSLAMAAGAILGVVAGFGTHQLSLKRISREHGADVDVLGVLLPMQALAGLVLWGAAAACVSIAGLDPTVAGFVLVIGAFHIIRQWIQLGMTRFSGREQMGYAAATEAGTWLLVALLGVLAISTREEPLAAAAAFPIGALVVLAALWWWGDACYGRPRYRLHWHEVREILSQAFPYFAIVGLSVLYARLGVLLLGLLDSETAVGLFASAERLIMPLVLLQTAFASAIFPTMARFSNGPDNGPDGRNALAVRCLRLLLVAAVPAATLLFLFSADIIALLYGPEFAGGVVVLQVVAWLVVPRGLVVFLSMVCVTTDHERIVPTARFTSLLAFVAAAALLIPGFSHVGLGIAILVAEGSMAVMLYVALHRRGIKLPIVRALSMPALACAIAIAATVYFDALPFAARVGVAGLALGAALLLVGAVRPRDFSFLSQVLRSGARPSRRPA